MKPSWSIFTCRQLISFRLPLTRNKIKWRTGSEGRINHLKRSYGWNHTELTTIVGARTWCGHGVFAHNLVKISTLAA